MTKQEQSMQYSIVVCMVCVILGALMLMGVVVSHYINTSKVEDTEVTKECWIYTDYDNTTVFEDADGNLWEIQAHFPDIAGDRRPHRRRDRGHHVGTMTDTHNTRCVCCAM